MHIKYYVNSKPTAKMSTLLNTRNSVNTKNGIPLPYAMDMWIAGINWYVRTCIETTLWLIGIPVHVPTDIPAWFVKK